MNFSAALTACPLVAILRGITPDESIEICAVLIEVGLRVIEVPLNSPDALASIQRMSAAFGSRAVIGAGTVMSAADIDHVKSAGGRLIVMPHSDPFLIRAAKAAGLWCAPGVATPTEAFSTLAAGADALKLFPAEMIAPSAVKAMRAVLPRGAILIPVGGISAANIPHYRSAGANAFGIGSTLYAAGKKPADVRLSARALLQAVG